MKKAVDQLKNNWKDYIAAVSDETMSSFPSEVVEFLEKITPTYVSGMWDLVIEYEKKKYRICLVSNPYAGRQIVVYPHMTEKIIKELEETGNGYGGNFKVKTPLTEFFSLPLKKEQESVFINLFFDFNFSRYGEKIENERIDTAFNVFTRSDYSHAASYGGS